MKPLRDYLRRSLNQPMVRPFALAGPVLVLIIALPMLRPLRHPNPNLVNNDEILRIATVRTLVENRSLSLDQRFKNATGTVTTDSGIYSVQPPMMALLLSAPAWMMTHLGFSFDDNQLLIEYLLTVLGVTLPVAWAAGLVYRMGRLFELRRPWRMALGFIVVAGSGLLTYSVVLNPYAPAASLVIGSAACLIHASALNRNEHRGLWFALAGTCAALAATIDPAATVFLLLFLFVIPAMRFSIPRRIGGILLFILGATPIISLHAAWNVPITGDIIPASLHHVLKSSPATPLTVARDLFEDEESATQSMWDTFGGHLLWLTNATIGSHGLFSHFPIIILGIAGIAAVMHRHWPGSAKTLAAATGVGAVIIVVLYRLSRLDWISAMFASKWFVVFTPMLLFWFGAWLRRKHTPAAWTAAAVLLLFSIIVGLIGATDPMPRHGFNRYTAAGALMRLTQPQQPAASTALADRSP